MKLDSPTGSKPTYNKTPNLCSTPEWSGVELRIWDPHLVQLTMFPNNPSAPFTPACITRETLDDVMMITFFFTLMDFLTIEHGFLILQMSYYQEIIYESH